MNNPVKTLPVLQVSSWSLGGQLSSWESWNWCQPVCKCIQNLCWKFHSILTRKTMSRQLQSSKCNFGGLDDGVILTWSMACGVSFKGIPCDRHSLVPFPDLWEPPIMRYHICIVQFWDFRKWPVSQKRRQKKNFLHCKIFFWKQFTGQVFIWDTSELASPTKSALKLRLKMVKNHDFRR